MTRISTVLSLLSILGSVILGGCWHFGPDPLTDENARSIVLCYLARCDDSRSAIERQLFPDVNLLLYSERDTAVLFTLHDSLCNKDERNRRMAPYINDTNRLTWNWTKKGYVVVGGYHYKGYLEAACACRAKVKDMLLKPTTQLSVSCGKEEWRFSVMELAEIVDNRHMYKHAAAFDTMLAIQKSLYTSDYGLFSFLISPSGDSSLMRLTQTVLKGVSSDETHREERVQKLLDFVTEEIADEPRNDSTTLRHTSSRLIRPHEVVIYGKGTEASKTFLMASLLEQINEDYLLVTTADRVYVAIARGKFPKQGEQSFEWDGTEWTLCDVSVHGFRIGADISANLPRFQQIRWVQHPKRRMMVSPHNGNVGALD